MYGSRKVYKRVDVESNQLDPRGVLMQTPPLFVDLTLGDCACVCVNNRLSLTPWY